MNQDLDPNNNRNTNWLKNTSQLLTAVNGILDKIGDLLPWIKHWLSRPVIVPHQRENWWHMGKTGGQKPAMQVVGYWYVTNRTNRPITILNAHIRKPKTPGHVMLKDVHSDYHGSYTVPPYTTTDLHADFWIVPPVCREGKDLKVDIIFIDQYGQKRKLRNVVFKSDKKNKNTPLKLKEEAIYQLNNEIEKKVASILKDEISRYKKNGRRSGELGSIYAIHGNGTRRIKSVYQDGWSSSRSGERQEIIAGVENSRIYTENGDALVEFFKSINNEADKDLFVNSLIARLNRHKEYYCVSYLILYVMFRIGYFTKVMNAAKNALDVKNTFLKNIFHKMQRHRAPEGHQRYGFSDFLGLLNGLLRFEHASFSNYDLDIIEEFINGTKEYSFSISEKINSIRALRVNR